VLVRDILQAKQKELITIRSTESVRAAMDRLVGNKVSCLPVVDENEELNGIISDKDIFRKSHTDPHSFTEAMVGDLMTREVIVGLPDDTIDYIAGIMTKNRIRHIPIVEGRKLAGLISVGDIVKTHMENIKIENRYLRQYIDGSYPG